jgi:hypothetical protein
VVVDLQAAAGKLGDEPPYGEVAVLDPLRQPDRVVSRNRLGLLPPIWPGATPPISSTRCIQPIAVLIATPNCLAARLRDIPPSIAATTRLRRSRE